MSDGNGSGLVKALLVVGALTYGLFKTAEYLQSENSLGGYVQDKCVKTQTQASEIKEMWKKAIPQFIGQAEQHVRGCTEAAEKSYGGCVKDLSDYTNNTLPKKVSKIKEDLKN